MCAHVNIFEAIFTLGSDWEEFFKIIKIMKIMKIINPYNSGGWWRRTLAP